MDQAEWEEIKKRGKPSDEEYEKRYQSLLNRYGIKGGGDTGNVVIDKASGAAQVEVTPKDESRAVKEGSKKEAVKEEKKAEAKKPAVKKKASVKVKKKAVQAKKNIGGEASGKAHTPRDKKEPVVSKAYTPRDKLTITKKPTLASLRNEYQQELIAKHKKELNDLKESKQNTRAIPNAPSKSLFKRIAENTQADMEKLKEQDKKKKVKTNNLASARNEYQQELIKKHKKELSGS